LFWSQGSTCFNEIPASIPSNQLKSNSSVSIKNKKKKKDEYDFDENEKDDDDIFDIDEDTNTQGHFRLYINTNDNNRQQAQQTEIEDISINLDTTVNNSSLNQANSSLVTKLVTDTDARNNERNDFDFDELAMLCSGNFKADVLAKSGDDRSTTQEVNPKEDDDGNDDILFPKYCLSVMFGVE
jgi:hypothetical protein